MDYSELMEALRKKGFSTVHEAIEKRYAMQMTRMEHKGFFARIKEADRLTGDYVHSLPPGRDLPVYQADAFKVYPENWMKGPGVFVVPVRPNKGLWFDWRDNDASNTAIIPTVKGCNPITGLQTTGFFLEKYEMKCPKHGCDLQAQRFCPECGYKLPDRNYVSQSPLWWDGFRSEDGSVRQFFFTEDMMRDIATHMIGKENTVPAFGFAFYSTKNPRPKVVEHYIYNLQSYTPPTYMNNHVFSTSKSNLDVPKGNLRCAERSSSSIDKLYRAKTEASYSVTPPQSNQVVPDMLTQAEMAGFVDHERCYGINQNSTADMVSSVEIRESYTPQKEVSVGAGVKIRQELPIDTGDLGIWKDKPDSVMTVYFVFQEEFNRMAAGGFKDFKDCKDGMLNGLPVG